MVTDGEIDAAVPADGIPNRMLTNGVLKRMRDDALNPGRQIAEVAPASGSTVAFLENPRDMVLIINGDQMLASLELVLPSNEASAPGQLCRVIAYVSIDELTVTGADEIMGAPPQVFEGDSFAFFKSEDGKWFCYG